MIFVEIKEVENLLSVSRSNIRFYEKEGLITPERGENNYRNYSEADIAMLKKIIVLRKLGFSVEEISSMQQGNLQLSDAIKEDITRLETEIENLKGALETAKVLSSEQSTFEAFDEERYWNAITQAEKNGKEFADICKDYLLFELDILDNVWKRVFLHDFKKSRQKHGTLIAIGILFLLCLLRGLAKVVFWHETFWEGFLYPILLFLVVSLTLLPLYILNKKAPKAASVIASILLILCVLFLAFLVLLIIYLLIKSIFV